MGLLAGLLLPAVQRVRESAARAKCLNNLRQIAVAFHGHESAHGHFPDGGTMYWATPDGAAWGLQILPHLEQQAAFSGRRGEAPVPAYECPLRPRRVWPSAYGRRAMTDYAANAGNDESGTTGWGMLGDGRDGAVRRRSAGGPVRAAEFRSGLSNTLLAAERRLNDGLLYRDQTDDDSGWIDGWDWDVVRWTREPPERDWTDPDVNHAHSGFAARHGQFGGPHPSGVPLVRADGSAGVSGWGTDPGVWRRLGSRLGGLPPPE